MCIQRKKEKDVRTTDAPIKKEEEEHVKYELVPRKEAGTELYANIVTAENRCSPFWVMGPNVVDVKWVWDHQVKEMFYGDDPYWSEKFNKIPNDQGMRYASDANPDKNREGMPPCQDDGRVILNYPGLKSDYIHANFVGTQKNPKRFIATQSPTEHTEHAFWAMIIQEQVSKIVVMDTEAPDYFYPYWHYPNEIRRIGETPNTIVIVNSDEIVHMNETKFGTKVTPKFRNEAGITQIRMLVQWGADKCKSVDIFKITKWMPEYFDCQLVELMLTVWNNQHPVVVHCGSGVGYTGTFVAIACLHENMSRGNTYGYDVIQTIRELRQQRYKMVLLEEHGEWIIKAITFLLDYKCGYKSDYFVY